MYYLGSCVDTERVFWGGVLRLYIVVLGAVIKKFFWLFHGYLVFRYFNELNRITQQMNTYRTIRKAISCIFSVYFISILNLHLPASSVSESSNL